jgi:hypothetical protein
MDMGVVQRVQFLGLKRFKEVLLDSRFQQVFANFVLESLQDDRHRRLALPKPGHACLPLVLAADCRVVLFQRLGINFNAHCPLTAALVHYFNFQWIVLNVLDSVWL